MFAEILTKTKPSMAIINCSECGSNISDKAEKCPHCGNPINISQPQKVEVTSAPNKEGCFLQTMNIGCAIVLGIILFVVLLFVLGAIFNGE